MIMHTADSWFSRKWGIIENYAVKIKSKLGNQTKSIFVVRVGGIGSVA